MQFKLSILILSLSIVVAKAVVNLKPSEKRSIILEKENVVNGDVDNYNPQGQYNPQAQSVNQPEYGAENNRDLVPESDNNFAPNRESASKPSSNFARNRNYVRNRRKIVSTININNKVSKRQGGISRILDDISGDSSSSSSEEEVIVVEEEE